MDRIRPEISNDTKLVLKCLAEMHCELVKQYPEDLSTHEKATERKKIWPSQSELADYITEKYDLQDRPYSQQMVCYHLKRGEQFNYIKKITTKEYKLFDKFHQL